MSDQNIGSQRIFYNSSQISGSELSQMNYALRPTGVYSRLVIDIQDAANNLVSVREINNERWTIIRNESNGADNTQIVFNTNYPNISVSSTRCYVVIRYARRMVNPQTNYAEVLGVEWTTSNPTMDTTKLFPDDIIVGKCIFNNGVLTGEMDYSKQPYVDIFDTYNLDGVLYVETTEPESNTVNIIGGNVFINGIERIVPNQIAVVPPVTTFRHDLFYMTEVGEVAIESGTDEEFPTIPAPPPGTIPIASISRSGPTNVVYGYDIINIPTKKYVTVYENISGAITAHSVSYSPAATGLPALNVQTAIDQTYFAIPVNSEFTLASLGERSYNSLTDTPDIPTNSDFTLASLGEHSYNSLSDKPHIPVNSDFTLASLSEHSYNSLTDQPDIPINSDFTLASLGEHSYNSLSDKPTIITTHGALTGIGTYTHNQIDSHIDSRSNPHVVTASQLGLGTTDSPSFANVSIASTITLSAGSAPTTTTDKLYNIGGKVYWDGAELGASVSVTASNVSYDHTSSGLAASNVQTAVDEVVGLIPANSEFTLASLGEHSYNSLTDRPTIISSHNALSTIELAQAGVTYGHITDAAQTIAGTKSFVSFPITPSSAPVNNYEVANKKYVDDAPISAGIISKPTITNNNNGTLTLGSGVYASYADTQFTLPLVKYTVAGATYSFTDNTTNYVIFSCSPTPAITVSTSRDSINQSCNIPILTVYREGNELHILDWDEMGKGLANKISDRLVRTERFSVETGSLNIGEVATRTITLTDGYVWYGAVRVALDAVNSSTDQCELWYHLNGNWTKTSITQYNNTQYDNGTDLATLSSTSKYAVNWIFRGIENAKHLFVVLGGADYKLSEAEASTIPLLPSIISSQAILVGRIIVAKAATSAYSIQSAFATIFNRTPVTAHDELSNLQYADTGVSYGHINDQAQTIYGVKTFNSFPVTPSSAPLSTYDVANKYYVDQHSGNTNNPHAVTAAQVGLGTTTSPTFANATIGGVDINNYFSVIKDPTGFASPENVVVSYDSSTRKVTLTGTVEAYWKGVRITALTSGWISEAIPVSPTVPYFLYYDGANFIWSPNVWTFDLLQICYVYYNTSGTFIFGQREPHSFMEHACHENLHKNIGTYLKSGGDLSGVTIGSTTAAQRRPDTSSTTIMDEDLPTVLAAKTDKLYNVATLTGVGVTNFAVDQADIVPLTGNNPNYNAFQTPNWIQTPMPNNSYMCLWKIAIPVTSDAASQKYRYLWIQGQSTGTLASQQALTPASLVLGDLTAIASEFAFINKVIIRFTSNNWSITQIDKLTGNKTSYVATTGSYLSSVTTDDTLTGTGSVISPLSVTNWKPAVANLAALPSSGNVAGDVRKVLDTFKTYYWNGSAWIEETGGSTMATFDATIDFGTGSTYETAAVSYPSMTATQVVQVFYTNKLEEVAILGMTTGESSRTPGVGFSVFGFTQLGAIGTYTVKIIISGT